MSIKVQNLYKDYGSQRVLSDVSFEIEKGQIVGFLGNNGAGKSTTMKIITGYRSFNSGRVEVCGIDIAANPMEARRHIGYLPEHNPIYPDMYIREYLRFVADVFGVDNSSRAVDNIIDQTGLGSEAHKKIGMLSKGYRQRVGLAQALLHNPDVLILDEPTTGLDPNQIIEVRDLIREVGQQKTVLLSTHIMQEVSAICNRVLILNNGSIVADDQEEHLRESFNGLSTVFVEFSGPVEQKLLHDALATGASIRQVSPSSYLVASEADVSAILFNFAVNNSLTIRSMGQHQRSIEDVFRDLTASGGKHS